ncbi:2-amino-4-hydroxy-6-hydroxymethyldihydropteridine diphosphokinase [Streptococcus dentasini]
MTEVYLSLGSNMGDRQTYLKQALARLSALPQTQLKSLSSIYESQAWGVTNQADFLNLACKLETQLPPLALLHFCQSIERDLGRVRHQHWGPRTLDIDILLYGQVTMDNLELQLPHPYMTQRAFVLVPLLEIEAELTEPSTGLSYASYLAELDCSGIRLNS